MVTNFDFLLNEPDFSSFAKVAVSAEALLHIDASAAVLNCRRALEFAIKWMYSVDEDLKAQDDERLVALMDNETFRRIIEEDIYFRMEMIRDMGNSAAHNEKGVSKKDAETCIEALFYVMDFIAYCYAEEYEQKAFNKNLLELTSEEALAFATCDTLDLRRLIEENRALREAFTAKRKEYRRTYVPGKYKSN